MSGDDPEIIAEPAGVKPFELFVNINLVVIFQCFCEFIRIFEELCSLNIVTFGNHINSKETLNNNILHSVVPS
jgi:hypothetical protein